MKVTNPDKVLFPKVGLVKADLVRHYEHVGEEMLPFVAGSPLTLERYPNGLQTKGFLQKHTSKHFPADLIDTITVPKRDGDISFPSVHSVEGLMYLANQGTITFHPWTSRLPDLDKPDFLVIDLDPVEGDIEGARAVAHSARAVLEVFTLEALLVASGSKGFHLWCPIEPTHGFDVVSRCARAVAGILVEESASATGEFLKKDRGGRVFVDWMRNGFGASIASPLSVRARPTAPVATPIPWENLPTTEPDSWTIQNIGDRPPTTMPNANRLPVDEIINAAGDIGVDLDTNIDRFGRKR